MQNQALTPQAKEVILNAARFATHFENHQDGLRHRILNKYIEDTADSMGRIKHDYNYVQTPEFKMAFSKVIMKVIPAELYDACKQFAELAPVDNWGSLTDEASDVIREFNKDKNWNRTVSEYRLKDMVEEVLHPQLDSRMTREYMESQAKSMKRATYLKKVKKGDPLRAGLSDEQTCYEFTDAMFDNHTDVFSDVLFIGHQLRVVKNSDANYDIEKLNGKWVYVSSRVTLTECIFELCDSLRYIERYAVDEAVQNSERGLPIQCSRFTAAEVRQLAEARGIVLPEQKTFSVIKTNSWKSIESVTCESVAERTDVVKVVGAGLTFEEADKLREALNLTEHKATVLERAKNRQKRVEESLKLVKGEVSEAMTEYLRSVKDAAEVRNAIGLDPEVNVETEEKVEVAQ